MKTTLKRTLAALLAVLVLLPLAGCGQEAQNTPGNAQTNAGEKTPTSGDKSGGDANTEENNEAGDSMENAETEPPYPVPDYSDFVMPEDTGKLVVYTDATMGRAVMNPAVRIFEEKYPGVEVEYKTMGEDEFQALIRTEIPAGKGPDLLLFAASDLPDVYKTASTGLFTDLNPYFALDDEIDLSDFITPVMDGALLNEQRFFAPLNYDIPLLKTARSTLDEIGMTEGELATCDGFIEAINRFHEKHPAATLFINTFGGAKEAGDLITLYANFGFRMIDYATGEVEIDEELFKRCADTMKLYYDPNFDPKDSHLVQESGGWWSQGWAFYAKHCFFDNVFTGFSNMDITSYDLEQVGDELVMLAQTNRHDGITASMLMNTAILSGSANKFNAWRLMKILLSDDIQGGHDETRYGLPYFWAGFPVRRESLRGFLWEEDMEEDEVFRQYMEVVQSPTEALMIPQTIKRYINLEILPYVRGEKPWDDCYKRFLNTLELYASE